MISHGFVELECLPAQVKKKTRAFFRAQSFIATRQVMKFFRSHFQATHKLDSLPLPCQTSLLRLLFSPFRHDAAQP